MPSTDLFEQTLDKEIQGDASNLKGTDYHLLYVMWLLIVDGDNGVSFFSGNDLVVRRPPSPMNPESLEALACLNLPDGQTDVWVQLKATQANWSVSALFDENLLRNFFLNSCVSVENSRNWKVSLVTTASISQSEIAEFVNDPQSKTKLNRKLNSVVRDLSSSTQLPEQEIRSRCIDILNQISKCNTVPREVLKAQIREQTAYLVGDREIVDGVIQQIYGAILSDAVSTLSAPTTYTRDWIEKLTGTDFSRAQVAEMPVLQLCNQQISDQEHGGEGNLPNIERRILARHFERFLGSDSTMFVLSGATGSGKTVAIHSWLKQRESTLRLFIPASNLGLDDTLVKIIARALPQLAKRGQSDAVKRLLLAVNSDKGPLIIALDDVRPSVEQPDEYAKMLSRLCDEAYRQGIKLIVSCQSDFLSNQRPFSAVSSSMIFNLLDLRFEDRQNRLRYSYELRDFDDSELVELCTLFVSEPRRAEQLYLRLRDSTLTLLRNPALLTAFLLDGEELAVSESSLTKKIMLALDRKSARLVQAASTHCRQSEDGVRETLNEVLRILWSKYPENLSRAQVQRHVGESLDAIGRECLTGLYLAGMLSDDRPEKFADRQLWARLLARFLHDQNLTVADICNKLDWRRDHDLVVQIVANHNDPVRSAEKILLQNSHWAPAVAMGLVFGDEADVRVLALLHSISRHSNEEGVFSALGRFASRSKVGMKWLRRLYFSDNHNDRSSAEHSLWLMNEFSPEPVRRLVHMRIQKARHVLSRTKWRSKEEEMARRCLGKAIGPLANTDHPGTAKRHLGLLCSIRSDVERVLTGTPDHIAKMIHVDDLIQDYDEVVASLSVVAGEQNFVRFLETFDETDMLSKARKVNAVSRVVHQAPELIKQFLTETVSTCSNGPTLSRVLWIAYGILKTNAEELLAAMKINAENIWASYESVGAALSLLYEAATLRPSLVNEVLLTWSTQDVDERFAWTAELTCSALSRCRRPLGNLQLQFIEVQLRLLEDWPKELEFHRLRTRILLWFLKYTSNSEVPAFPEIHRVGYRKYGSDFFMTYIEDWISEVDFSKVTEADLGDLLKIWSDYCRSAKHPRTDIRNDFKIHARFLCERDCIGAVMQLIAVRPSKWKVIQELEDDWQQLFASSVLLTKGVRDSELFSFALDACGEKRRSATAQASSDRSNCLAWLAKVVPDKVPPIEVEKHGIADMLTGGLDRTKQFASYFESNESQAIQFMEDFLKQKENLPLLRGWNDYAISWKAIAISELYSRVLNPRRISVLEARYLAKSYVCALSCLPSSDSRDSHINLYEAILDRFNGRAVNFTYSPGAATPLNESHCLASEIITLSESMIDDCTIQRFLSDRRGWAEDDDIELSDDGTMSKGWGVNHYMAFFFPAVRLALCAIGCEVQYPDPASDWVLERRIAELAVKDVLIPNFPKGEYLIHAIRKLTPLYEKYPNQDALAATLGHFLVTNKELEKAEQCLLTALSLTTCVGPRKFGVHYNLACVYARGSNRVGVETQLRLASEVNAISLESIREDSDFDDIRSEEWFIQLVDQIASESSSVALEISNWPILLKEEES